VICAALSKKKKRSSLRTIFMLILYSVILLTGYEYVTNAEFRQSVNDGVSGFVTRTGEYISSLKDKDGPGFSMDGLFAAISGEEDKSLAASTGSVPTPTKKPSSTRKPFSSNFYTGSGTSTTSSISTRDDLVAAIKEKSADKPTSIYISLSPFLYNMAEDRDWLTEVIYDAGIRHSTWTRRSSAGSYSITFNEITYMDAISCTSVTHFENLLKGAKETGTLSIRPSPELYAQLKENDYALVYAIEGKAGIIDGTFTSYKEPYRVFEFKDLVFADNFHKVTSVDQVKQCLYESSKRGDTSIALYCSEDTLYNRLTGRNAFTSDTSVVSVIAQNCGISHPNFLFNESKNLIYSTNLGYQPGVRIAFLAKNGQLSKLTPAERALYDRAMLMANRCKATSSDDYELVMSICTEISTSASYQYCEDEDCGGCERDNAYGVLMQGSGECDSYTDAFYLVASLAGLNVGYQLGHVNEEYYGKLSDNNHVWNTVTLNGNTYFLDMTWADDDSDTHPLEKNWILAGSDLMQHSHIWNKDLLLKPISVTSRKYFPFYRENCTFGSPMDAASYIRSQAKKGAASVDVMLIMKNNTSEEELAQQILDGLHLGGSYLHRSIGNHFFFTYYFAK